MKRFTFILCFFLSIVTAFCQQFTCLNVNKSFSGDGNAGSYIWGIQNLVTGAFVNGSVATISGGVTQFGVAVAGASASNVIIKFTKAGLYSVKVLRFTNSFWGSTVRFQASTDVTVPGTTPTFAFAGPNGECGAIFALNNTLEPVSPTQPQPALQWKRENPAGSGIFVPIPGETGTILAVQPPFRRLQLEANYGSCGAKASILDPPAGLADFSLTSPDAFSPICANSNQEFTAVARFCGATAADAWTWFSDGAIQFTSPPVNGVFTSSIKFIVVGSGFGSITAQKGNTQSNPLSFDVLQFPSCEFLLRKPKDDNTVLPTSVKSESDKISISDDPNSDLKTENTEEVTISNSKNNASIKKAIYPNPANDFLNVDDVIGVQAIQIIDINGKLIRTVDIEQNEISRTLNVSNLSDGMYILKKIKQDGQLEAAKFQVIH